MLGNIWYILAIYLFGIQNQYNKTEKRFKLSYHTSYQL